MFVPDKEIADIFKLGEKWLKRGHKVQGGGQWKEMELNLQNVFEGSMEAVSAPE